MSLLRQAEFAAERMTYASNDYDEGYWLGSFTAYCSAFELACERDQDIADRAKVVRGLVNSNFEMLTPSWA